MLQDVRAFPALHRETWEEKSFQSMLEVYRLVARWCKINIFCSMCVVFYHILSSQLLFFSTCSFLQKGLGLICFVLFLRDQGFIWTRRPFLYIRQSDATINEKTKFKCQVMVFGHHLSCSALIFILTWKSLFSMAVYFSQCFGTNKVIHRSLEPAKIVM